MSTERPRRDRTWLLLLGVALAVGLAALLPCSAFDRRDALFLATPWVAFALLAYVSCRRFAPLVLAALCAGSQLVAYLVVAAQPVAQRDELFFGTPTVLALFFGAGMPIGLTVLALLVTLLESLPDQR